MKKLGFRFSAIPRDRHPEWFEVPLFTRMLGHELYAASCDDGGASKPIPVASNWRTSLCRTLCIEPEDRPAISQAFSAMEKRGLIKVEDDAVHIIWNPKDKLFKPPPAEPELPPPCDPAEPPLTDPCGGAAGGLWSASPRNDSTLVSREDKKRGEENARARENSPPSEPEGELEPWFDLGICYRECFEESQKGAREPLHFLPDQIWANSKTFVRLLALAKAEARARHLKPSDVFIPAAQAFLADPRQRENGYVLNWFAQDFARWVNIGLRRAS